MAKNHSEGDNGVCQNVSSSTTKDCKLMNLYNCSAHLTVLCGKQPDDSATHST